MSALTALQRPVVAGLAVTAVSLLFVPVALNVVGQVNGGGMQTSGAGTARWIIDSTSVRAEDGSSPRPRVEFGNLPANGVSAIGWKFRANDATGAPIFDSDGLIGVMQPLGSAHVTGTTVATANSGTYADVPGSSVSISLTRPARVLVFSDITAYVSGGSVGPYSYVITTIDGVYYGGAEPLFGESTSWTNASMVSLTPVLAAGTHYVVIRAATDAGETINIYQGGVNVFLLGG